MVSLASVASVVTDASVVGSTNGVLVDSADQFKDGILDASEHLADGIVAASTILADGIVDTSANLLEGLVDGLDENTDKQRDFTCEYLDKYHDAFVDKIDEHLEPFEEAAHSFEMLVHGIWFLGLNEAFIRLYVVFKSPAICLGIMVVGLVLIEIVGQCLEKKRAAKQAAECTAKALEDKKKEEMWALERKKREEERALEYKKREEARAVRDRKLAEERERRDQAWHERKMAQLRDEEERRVNEHARKKEAAKWKLPSLSKKKKPKDSSQSSTARTL